ncbi:DUF2178 domain-containing protein [Allonocardiopsis opalescens]|uniref:Putative membrane protein DUF2178 n=1 Tax=Allonocardiopsis opalescens TaxID=1144618 RepID=A0A2T0Q4T6_9ACTN|nr:DUF2178 domain-containing protein [Allonocardiopsis opalescens]PRX98759.1 putative membrane protein DUF2178 [Allonocardiopsis opalescens]
MPRLNRWVVPATGLFLGLCYLAVGLYRGEPAFGLTGLGVMVAYVVIIAALSRRSEVAQLLSTEGGDERQRLVLLKASAATLNILVVLGVATAFWTLATGHNALFGYVATTALIFLLVFVGTLVYFSRRG